VHYKWTPSDLLFVSRVWIHVIISPLLPSGDISYLLIWVVENLSTEWGSTQGLEWTHTFGFLPPGLL